MEILVDRRAILAMLAVALAGAGVAKADDDRRGGRREGDHERARRALEEGRARPLAEILARLGDGLGGEVIEVEFDREDGRYVYELKVIGRSGRLREVKVDALTAEILESEDD